MMNTHTHTHTHTRAYADKSQITITIIQSFGCTIILTHTALGVYVKRIDAATGVYMRGVSFGHLNRSSFC
jgi:hypothetical protein